MSFTTTLSTWATEREERKAERWRKRQEATAHMLPAWRTPQRRRLLLTLYFLSLALGVIVSIGQLFWTPLILGWILTTLGICVFWTMLRTTIDCKDDAPLEVLDEYEESVVNAWRKTSHDLMVIFNTIFIGLLVFFTVSAFDKEQMFGYPPLWLIYTWSLLGILIMLTIASLPAVGYVMAFASDEDYEDAG